MGVPEPEEPQGAAGPPVLRPLSPCPEPRRAEAEKFAGPIGEVVSFSLPPEHAAKYLHEPQRNLDDTASHYALRRILPARYVSDDP